MKILKLVPILLLAATTASCTIVPGSHMQRSLWWFDETPPEYVEASTDIDYIPLNSTVISNLRGPSTPSAQANPQLEAERANYQYRVGPGDVLTITVWEHPELTIPAGSYRSAAEGGNQVKQDGTIFYPYAGDLHVAGLTSSEIKDLIKQKLSDVIRKPQVDVRVADYRSQKVFVTGSVMQPGIVPITNIPLTLVDAIDLSGGLTEFAGWSNIVVTRGNTQRSVSLESLYLNGSMTDNLLLKDGDILHVPDNSSEKVFVLGEVVRPQGVIMSRNGTTLAEALAESNGINERAADGRGIYVLRNAAIERDTNGQPVYKAKVFHLDASSAMGFALADRFPLEPRDVVYVSAAPISRWNRFLSQLLPSITATNVATDISNN